MLVTWHPDANVPRPCRSHKADVQGQEPVLGAPSLIQDDSALFCASLGGVVCRGAGLRSSGSAADRCLPSPRDKTEKNWPPDESDGNGGGDGARVGDGCIIEPRSRFQRWSPPRLPPRRCIRHVGPGLPPMTQCSGDAQEPRSQPSLITHYPSSAMQPTLTGSWMATRTDGAGRSTLSRWRASPRRRRHWPSRLRAYKTQPVMQPTPRLSHSTHRFLAGQLVSSRWNVARGPICLLGASSSGCCPTGDRPQARRRLSLRYPTGAAASSSQVPAGDSCAMEWAVQHARDKGAVFGVRTGWERRDRSMDAGPRRARPALTRNLVGFARNTQV